MFCVNEIPTLPDLHIMSLNNPVCKKYVYTTNLQLSFLLYQQKEEMFSTDACICLQNVDTDHMWKTTQFICFSTIFNLAICLLIATETILWFLIKLRELSSNTERHTCTSGLV